MGRSPFQARGGNSTAKRHHWAVQLPFVFGFIFLSFVAATALIEWRLGAIDESALDIAEIAAPSIRSVSAARSEMRRMEVLLSRGLDQAETEAFSSQAIERSSNQMHMSLIEYLDMPVLPREQGLWTEISRRKDALQTAVSRCLTEAQHGDVRGAKLTLHRDVSTAADALDAALSRDIVFHAARSRELAHRIAAVRERSTRVALALSIVCMFITVAGALALHRAMRATDDLAERHRRVVEERASELEEFAGRIAHDILSPLGTVTMALQLSERPGTEERRAAVIERGTRAVDRIKRLVDGLLGFARAGAKPEPGAHAEVAKTIGDLDTDLQSAAREAGVELHVNANLPCHLACSGGVLASVVGNLALNAIKYVGEGPVRRVEIRARDEGQAVRVEVQDTGPGLPPGLEEHVFEPYVRGRAVTQTGIGLGLATVKRLIEGHGGRVGVRSIPGEGCTFWFELPKVADATSITRSGAWQEPRAPESREDGDRVDSGAHDGS